MTAPEYARTVGTQAELDRALADAVEQITLAGDRFEIAAGEPYLITEGSSQPSIVAWDSSQPRIVAWDSSQPSIVARDSSQPSIVARGSSQPSIVAWDSSQPRIVARDSSQPRIVARDSSQPRIVARDSSQPSIVAWDSSQPSIVAWDSSQPSIEAWGSSQIQARGHGRVNQHTEWTVVTCYGERIEVTGSGVVVRVPDLTDPAVWVRYHGIEPDADGVVTVYKAVDDRWTTGRGTDYSPGSTPEAPDWRPTNECGGGLHFGPTPHDALAYHRTATRFVAAGVALADLRPIVGDRDAPKCKAPRVVRACVAVDEFGRELAASTEGGVR